MRPYHHHNETKIDDVQKFTILHSVRRRIPWLILGLLGGVLAAEIISNFEEILSKNLILAAFIPMIVYMSDAVGTQIEAFAIRDFALHSRLKFKKYFMRQLVVVAVIAVLMGVLTYIISFLLGNGAIVSLVLSVSLTIAILSSIFTGLLIPYLFNRIKLDPANASGPIATIIQDILSVTIYFTLAHFLLS